MRGFLVLLLIGVGPAGASVNDELARLLPAVQAFSAACGERRDAECNRPDAAKLAADTLRVAGTFVGLASSETAADNPNPNPNTKTAQVSILTKNGDTKAVRVPQRAFQFFRQARELEQTLRASHGERIEVVAAAVSLLELVRSMQELCNTLSVEAPL